MRKIWTGIGALALIASASQAQLIVANDQSGTGTIWHVDISTGVATALYSSSTSESKAWGMAYDPGSNTLYWNNGGNLYASAFSLGGLTPTLVAGLTYNGSNTNFVGLGWRNGNLVGTRNISTEGVYTINPVTGVATLNWAYSSTFDFGGLDVDATDGKLYGLSDSGGAGLYAIDDVNQTTTFVAPYPGGETDIDGLAVHNGIAYYVTDGPNTTQMNFYMYDIASGSLIGMLPSTFTGSGIFSAAAFVPAPGVIGLLGAAGIVATRRRR
ncbi:MAG: hypothetical protein DYG94_11990 [Leptolyngbya sp. PLA3]|nr:MAG: hypothetical protein EDM82_05460 [Cyanobacteria bacterium CYA]MCE7969446.1 hypothetical protein [Leptolyngbya sp. PL-A3]